MKFQGFDWYCWSIGFLFTMAVAGLLGVYFLLCGGPLLSFDGASIYFCFDSVSVYLILLSSFLFISLFPVLQAQSVFTRLLISVSVLFSLLSYVCVHGLLFWLCYEMSILPLLVLLVLESPYSERYLASWYFMGYIVLSGLPALLCIFYMGFFTGSFDLHWCAEYSYENWPLDIPFIVLSVLFMSKIPLPPFHVWLPIVHAESSSVVSMCLSGYVMKLGLLGVCRFCSYVLPFDVFNGLYIFVALCFSFLFFFSASRELDAKRWLAFVSMSHILIASLCLSIGDYCGSELSFVYSLGHGLSAGLVFYLLWFLYEMTGSRNWNILKYSMGGSLSLRVLSAVSICSCASIPPTLQFFSELFILLDCFSVRILFVFILSLYLFIGGIVPMFLVGCLLTRHFTISFNCGYIYSYLCGCAFLCFWGYALFLVI